MSPLAIGIVSWLGLIVLLVVWIDLASRRRQKRKARKGDEFTDFEREVLARSGENFIRLAERDWGDR